MTTTSNYTEIVSVSTVTQVRESKFGKRQREAIQRIIGYNGRETVEYDLIEEDATGAILSVKIGAESHPLTEMDWDMAMNDPSRLNKRDKPAHTEYRIHVSQDYDGYITGGYIISQEVQRK